MIFNKTTRRMKGRSRGEKGRERGKRSNNQRQSSGESVDDLKVVTEKFAAIFQKYLDENGERRRADAVD